MNGIEGEQHLRLGIDLGEDVESRTGNELARRRCYGRMCR